MNQVAVKDDKPIKGVILKCVDGRWSDRDGLAPPPTLLVCAYEVVEKSPFVAVHESAYVEGFGCRPIAAMRLAPWPASESLQ